jgi:hypothetical protein
VSSPYSLGALWNPRARFSVKSRGDFKHVAIMRDRPVNLPDLKSIDAHREGRPLFDRKGNILCARDLDFASLNNSLNDPPGSDFISAGVDAADADLGPLDNLLMLSCED